MKLRKIILGVLLSFIFVSCGGNKESITPSDWLNYYVLQDRSNKVTIAGRAMKGRIKEGTIKIVPLDQSGKCDRTNPKVIATTSTDDKGNYSVSYERIGQPICVFVVPSENASSKMYDEFSKTDLNWSGDSFLVSVMNEPSIQKRKQSGLSITPLTRFAAGRLEALVGNVNSDSTNINSLVSRSNKEIASRFGIRRTSLFSKITENVFSKTDSSSTANEDFPEISEVEIDFDNPNDKNAVAQKAILGGLSVIANQTRGQSEVSTSNVEGVIDTFSRYVSSGRNDGRDKDGNILTIPGSDVPLGNNAITSVISTAINTYIQSGGAEEIGVSPTQITSTITLQDKLPETVPNTIGDITPPEVLSFSPANDATNILPNTTITVTFNEPIDASITSLNTQATNGTCRGTIQVSADDFKNCIGLTVNSQANPTIVLTPTSSLQGSSTYKVRVTTGLVDKAINPIALTTSRGFTTVDLTQPVVLDVSSLNANASYQSGASINVRVTYAIPVIVTGTPRIRLNTTPVMYANYISGSGTTTLDFSYVIGTTENSTDLDYASTTALELNGATITNSNGLANAFLTLPTPGANGSLGANRNIVIDNSFPVVNFASLTSSGSESVLTPTIAVNLSKSYFQTVTVNYSVTGGTASGTGVDFTLASGTLTFPAGTTTQSIPLSIINDSLNELDETILITLASPTKATIGTIATHTYTITDDDTAPTVSFGTASSSNSEATTSVSIPVTLSAVSGQAVTVGYSVTSGTATGSGIDFTLAAGTLTFPAGTTSQNISFPVTNDTTYEGAETLTLTLASPTNSTLGANVSHTYTITDDDTAPTVGFSTTSTSNSEAVLSASIPVTLSNPSALPVTVDYSVTGGTATTGTDFTLAAGTLTFPAGTTTQNISLSITNDALTEPSETIILTLASPTNSTIGTNVTHTYTITDDDVPAVAFSATTSSNSEATTAVSIPVTLTASSTQTITIDYSVTGGTATASADFIPSSGTLTFSPGVTSQNISLTVTNDSLSEATETIVLTLTNPTNSNLGTNVSHTYSITDDDAVPTVGFTATTGSGSEATTSVTIPVSLSTASGQAVTVGYSVTGGTATSGTDFTATSGTLTFPAGTTSLNITLPITNDTTYEGSETVILTLASPTASTIGANLTHTYTITDDDTAPTIQFTTTTSSASENAGTMTVTVDLSSASGLATTVPFTVNGSSTATGAGTDYTISASPINIPAGTTTGTITITLTNDTTYENSETIVIDMGSPTNATASGNTTHTATITNDDAMPTISFTAGASASVGEGAGNYVLSATLSTASGINTTVEINTANGSATSGTDYTAQVAQSLNITAGSTTGTLNIAITNDIFYEGNETFTVTMSSPVNATISGATQTVTITDNEIGIVSATTLDCDADGKIDHYQIVFDNPVTDSTFPGYAVNAIGTATAHWLVQGYSNVSLHHGASVNTACSVTDTANDSTIYLTFTESGSSDTGAKPDLTTSATPGLAGGFGTVGQLSTGSVAEADGAKPVITSITPANGSSNISISSLVATAVFSEDMNTGTFNGSNFTMTGASGISGTVATSNSTTVTFTAPTLAYNQGHTINIANMADVNGQTMNSFSSTFTTSLKNQITGTISNTGSPVTVTLTVNGTPTNFNGTTNFSTTNLLGIGDVYSLVITAQPPDKVCALLTDPSNPAGGTFSGTTNLTININCVNGHAVSGHIQLNPPAPLNFHLYQGNATTIAGQNNAGFTNGTGASAQFNGPTSVTFDGTNFYIADQGNAAIRQVTPAGVVTTIAGNGTQGFADGTGGSAQFQTPYGITNDGTYLYVAEYQGKRIRRIRIGTWEVTTLAGDTGSAVPVAAEVDGVGTAARFSGLHDVTLSGNELFITDREGHRVKKMNLSTRQVTTIAGNGTNATVDNATGTAGQIAYPNNLTVLGNYIYVGSEANVIRRINNNGTTYSLDTIVGQAGTASLEDGIGTLARVSNVRGLTSDGKDIYFSDVANGKIRKYDPATQRVTTLVGGIPNAHMDGIGIGASLAPYSVVTDGKNLFFTEGIAGNVSARFRKLSNNGLVAYYPLNGSGLDYAGSNTLTVTGTPTLTTGRFNEANGAYSIGAGNGFKTAAVGATFGISLAGWVKWDGTTGLNQILFFNGNSASNGFGFLIDATDSLRCLFGGGTSTVINPKLQPNLWTHLALVGPPSGGGKWKVYINGKEVASIVPTINTPTGFFTMGMNNADGENFRGAAADVRLYSRVLNEGEVNELAQNAASAQVGASYSTGATGLLVNFHMDGGTNNSIGAIPDLGLTGGTGANVNGKDGDANGARDFNGTSHFVSTNTPYGMPSGSAERTLCAWINPKQSANNHVILGYGNNAAGQGIGIALYLNKYFFWTYGGAGLTSTADVRLNSWQHYCGVYHPTNGAKIFVDGIELASTSAGAFGTVNTNIVSLTIGRNNIDTNNFFAGKIDDVSIYNQALTAIQIRQLAAQVPAGLVTRYDLNGDTNDVSGFGNNASITGTVTPAPNRHGIPGTAYQFPATLGNYLSAQDNILPKGSAPRTMCMWYRQEAGPTENIPFIYGGSGGRSGIWLQTENLVRFWTEAGDLNASLPVPNFIWRHTCIVYNGTGGQVYVNGRLVANNGSMPLNTSNGLIFIGSWTATREYAGQLDDLRIYNRPLSEPEIRALSGYHPMQVTTWNPTVGSSSLKFHLQADSLSNLANNAAVTGWNDSSGNNFHVSQGNASYQPTFQTAGINNQVAVRFTKTNLNSLSRACETSMLGSTHTILGVIKETDANGNNGIFQNGQYFGGGQGGKLLYFINSPGSRQLSFFNLFANGSTALSNVNFNPINQGVIFGVDHSGSTGTVFKNGANDTNASSSGGTYTCGTGDLSIGRYWYGATQADGGYFDGFMGDMLYFDQVLIPQNREIVECYLSSKYNIPLAPGVNCP